MDAWGEQHFSHANSNRKTTQIIKPNNTTAKTWDGNTQKKPKHKERKT